MFCINLCEILYNGIGLSSFLDSLISSHGGEVGRIYIGSSFCSQYFLKFNGFLDVLEYAKARKIPVTLTVPVFSQKDIGKAKKRIYMFLENDSINEVTVNDIGMLRFLQEEGRNVNLGRLFFRDPRDGRLPQVCERETRPFLLSHLKNGVYADVPFYGIELDPVSSVIDVSGFDMQAHPVALHGPYCYMTTGNICKYASIHYPPEMKFRPNLPCYMECTNVVDYACGKKGDGCRLSRFGRAVYFRKDAALNGTEEYRSVYFPIDEWRKRYADNGTSQVR